MIGMRLNVTGVILFCVSSLSNAGVWEAPKILDSDIAVRHGVAILVAQGPFVAIEQEVSLYNPHVGTLEANLNLELPQWQRLRGYALDINGKLRDAVVVDRVKGRVAFEDVVRQQVDSSIVEQHPGNRYSIRVFPILTKGQRQVRVDLSGLASRKTCGWETVLSRDIANSLSKSKSQGIVVYSDKKPSTVGLKVKRLSGKRNAWALTVKDKSARSNVQFCLPAPKGTNQVAWKSVSSSMVHFVETKVASSGKRLLPSKVELVWDNSLSMQGRKIESELALVSQYFSSRDVDLQLTLLGYDRAEQQDFQIINGDTRKLISYLGDLKPDGATRLADWRPSPVAQEVLMFTDGVNTWPGNENPIANISVHVYVITAMPTVDSANIRQLTRWGGQSINLMTTSVNQAITQLVRQSAKWHLPPIMSAHELGHGWHAANSVVDQGILRACVIDDSPVDVHWIDSTFKSHSTNVSAANYLQQAMGREMVTWCAAWAADDMSNTHPKISSTRAEFAKKYDIVTDETSLIVLEHASDYIKYGVLPLSNENYP